MRVVADEDDRRIAQMIRRSSNEAGYAVDVPHTAPSAVEAFELCSYELVLLDLMPPRTDGGGMAVCRCIQALPPDEPDADAHRAGLPATHGHRARRRRR